MSPNLRIAFRFLTAKKRAMLMSLSCIVLGVGLFIVTQATTSGFEDFFIKTILGTNGAILIQDEIQDTLRSMAGREGTQFMIRQTEGRKYIQGIEEPRLMIDELKKFSNISAISPVLTGPVTIRSAFGSDSVKVYGINFEEHSKVSDIKSQIVMGDANSFVSAPSSGAMLGREMAARLQLSVGDPFVLQTLSQQRHYRVSAIYETGVSDIDRVRVYLNMSEARSILKKPTGVSFIQINLIDKDRAVEDSIQMENVLHHAARPWQEREEVWLNVFYALKISSAITVSVFTLIAGLAMFNTLAMIVMEKTKEIAILRSMGYERKDISQIFLWQATIVLAIGSITGCILGAVVTYGVSKVPIHIHGIFATDHFLVSLSGWHYVSAVLTAIVMVMVASLVPARRAALLEPGDVIRGTAQ